MGRIAGEVEGVHFGIGDSDALSAGSLIERALDLQVRLGLVVVAPMSSTFDDGNAISRSVSRRPFQFCVIRQNRRRSILFHFVANHASSSVIPSGRLLDIFARRTDEFLLRP